MERSLATPSRSRRRRITISLRDLQNRPLTASGSTGHVHSTWRTCPGDSFDFVCNSDSNRFVDYGKRAFMSCYGSILLTDATRFGFLQCSEISYLAIVPNKTTFTKLNKRNIAAAVDGNRTRLHHWIIEMFS